MRRKGVGKKAAIKLLDGVKDKWTLYHITRMEYYKRFELDWESKMIENARLLFVGQRPDDLFEWNWLDKDWSE